MIDQLICRSRGTGNYRSVRSRLHYQWNLQDSSLKRQVQFFLEGTVQNKSKNVNCKIVSKAQESSNAGAKATTQIANYRASTCESADNHSEKLYICMHDDPQSDYQQQGCNAADGDYPCVEQNNNLHQQVVSKCKSNNDLSKSRAAIELNQQELSSEKDSWNKLINKNDLNVLADERDNTGSNSSDDVLLPSTINNINNNGSYVYESKIDQQLETGAVDSTNKVSSKADDTTCNQFDNQDKQHENSINDIEFSSQYSVNSEVDLGNTSEEHSQAKESTAKSDNSKKNKKKKTAFEKLSKKLAEFGPGGSGFHSDVVANDCYSLSLDKFEIVSNSEYSFRVNKIVGDGNCLFRCFSKIIFNTQEYHQLLRECTVDYTLTHWEEEESAVQFSNPICFYRTSDEYEVFMAALGEYGTLFEAGVLGKLFKINLEIFTRDSEDDKIIKKEDECTTNSQNPSGFYILFTGNRRKGHWEVLQKLNKDSIIHSSEQENFVGNAQESHTPDNSTDNCGKTRKYTKKKSIGNNKRSEQTKKTEQNGPCYRQDLEIEENEDTYAFTYGNNRIKVNEVVKYPIRNNEEMKINAENYHIETRAKQKSTSFKESQRSVEIRSTVSDSSELSDWIDDEFEKSREIKESSKQKKKIHRSSYNHDVGFKTVPSTDFKDEYDIPDDKIIKKVLGNYLVNDFKCTCSLGFHSYRINLSDMVFYAHCNHAICKNRDTKFKFRIQDIDQNIAKLFVYSTVELKVVHEITEETVVYSQLRNSDRKMWVEDSQRMGVQNKVNEVIRKSDPGLVADGHMQDIRRSSTVYKAVSEQKTAQRLKLESGDLLDLFQMWIQDQNLKDPFLRRVELPLTAIMHSEQDLQLALSLNKNVILHIDATGSIIRKPQDISCKKIFYYTLLLKHDVEIIKLTQMITSEHGFVSISDWLKNYRFFAMKIKRDLPFKAIVSDWAWVFIHSVVREWDEMSFIEYNKLLYKFCDECIELPKGFVHIKICCSHFINLVSRSIKQNYKTFIHNETKEKKLQKDVRSVLLDCFGLLILCKKLVDVDELFENICNLFLSTSEKEANDFLRKINMFRNTHVKSRGIANEEEEDENGSTTKQFEATDAEQNSDSMYVQSPFYQRYYKTYTVVYGKKHDSRVSVPKTVSNKYYAPGFLLHSLVHWIPYIVLWSGLDMHGIDKDITRISNAYIESSMRVTKEKLLKRNTRSCIGDVVRILNTDRKHTAALVEIGINTKGTKSSRQKPKYPNDIPNAASTDISNLQNTGTLVNNNVNTKRIKVPSRKPTYSDDMPNPGLSVEWDRKSSANLEKKEKHSHLGATAISRKIQKLDASINDENKKNNSCVEKDLTSSNKIITSVTEKAKTKKRKSIITEKTGTKKKRVKLEDQQNDELELSYNYEHSLSEAAISSSQELDLKMIDPTEIDVKVKSSTSISLPSIEEKIPSLQKKNKCQPGKRKLMPKTQCQLKIRKNVENNRLINKYLRNSLMHLERFPNRNFQNKMYYFASKSATISVAKFKSIASLSYDLIEITAKQFSTLCGETWINGYVIDAYIAVTIASSIKSYNKITYIPTDDTCMVLGDETDDHRIDKTRQICKTQVPLGKVILMPYLYCFHWRLLVVNVEEKSLTLLDSYEHNEDELRVVPLFEDFLKTCCSPTSTLYALRKIKWTLKKVRERPYQSTLDINTCGLYSMYYMTTYITGENMRMNFNPQDFAEQVAHDLLLLSEDMSSICTNCFTSAFQIGPSIKCGICHRFCHVNCLEKSYADTDDEEKLLAKLYKNHRPKPILSTVPDKFICKLCLQYMKMYTETSTT